MDSSTKVKLFLQMLAVFKERGFYVHPDWIEWLSYFECGRNLALREKNDGSWFCRDRVIKTGKVLAYRNRLGNDDSVGPDSEAYRYRGAGLFQITGKESWLRVTKLMSCDLETIASDPFVASLGGALNVAINAKYLQKRYPALKRDTFDDLSLNAFLRSVNGREAPSRFAAIKKDANGFFSKMIQTGKISNPLLGLDQLAICHLFDTLPKFNPLSRSTQ